jgi:LysR family transcriptional regulator, transcriptional activator of the cysJI operon
MDVLPIEVITMMTLEKLQSFLVLVECRSFTEAAKRLFCSQPRISHHIQQLEEYFGSKLFIRTGKQVSLTKQGEIFLQYAKQIVELMDEATVSMKREAQREQVLSVYVSNYISGYYFADILEHYHFQTPHKQLELNVFCYSDLVRCLQEGRTHYALMPIYPEDDYIRQNFHTSVLFEEELVLALPVNHPWKDRRILYARDLQNETILLPQSHYLQQYVTEHLSRKQVKVRYLQMSNFEMMKQAVRSHLGLAFFPTGAIRKEVENGELLSKPISSFTIKRKNGFVVRKDTDLSQVDHDFCQNVKDFIRLVR